MIGKRIFPELNDYTATVTIAPRSSANTYFPCISRSSAAFRSYDRQAHIFRTRQLPPCGQNEPQIWFSIDSVITLCRTSLRHNVCTATSTLRSDVRTLCRRFCSSVIDYGPGNPSSKYQLSVLPSESILSPPAMLHCNNSAVLFAMALLYRLCQTAPIKPRDRLCQNRLVNAVCALPYARHARSLALTRLPRLPDQTALHLRNCPISAPEDMQEVEPIKTRFTCAIALFSVTMPSLCSYP